jgi:hypothetical protein
MMDKQKGQKGSPKQLPNQQQSTTPVPPLDKTLLNQ